jgi:hypothetical protein
VGRQGIVLSTATATAMLSTVGMVIITFMLMAATTTAVSFCFVMAAATPFLVVIGGWPSLRCVGQLFHYALARLMQWCFACYLKHPDAGGKQLTQGAFTDIAYDHGVCLMLLQKLHRSAFIAAG